MFRLRSITIASLVVFCLHAAVIGGQESCPGDCDENGVVTIDDLLTMVRIGFGDLSVTACLAGDRDGDGAITVDEMLDGVNSALGGCEGTPGPPPGVLYVRQSGNDQDTGRRPDTAVRTISRAVRLAHDGYLIVVGPGTYREAVTTQRFGAPPAQALSFFGDTRGVATGDAAGPVVVDAGTLGAGLNVIDTGPATVGGRLLNPTIDGFTVIGATAAGVVIRGGSDVVIQGCTIVGTMGDGVRVQASPNALIFNNLIVDNADAGVAVFQGADGARIVSNTIVSNGHGGVSVGSTDQASSNALIRNNIVQDNGPDPSIRIFSPGDQTYMGGFNLVLPDVYDPPRIRRTQDLHMEALFSDAAAGDYSLQPSSPARNVGAALSALLTLDRGRLVSGALCFMQNDSACKVTLGDYLGRHTATGDGCDRGALDLGFHVSSAEECAG